MISRRNMLKTVAAALATVAVPLPPALPPKPGEGLVQAPWVIVRPIDVTATAEQIMSASSKLVAKYVKPRVNASVIASQIRSISSEAIAEFYFGEIKL